MGQSISYDDKQFIVEILKHDTTRRLLFVFILLGSVGMLYVFARRVIDDLLLVWHVFHRPAKDKTPLGLPYSHPKHVRCWGSSCGRVMIVPTSTDSRTTFDDEKVYDTTPVPADEAYTHRRY